MTLGEVLTNLSAFEEESFILVPQVPVLSPDTPAKVVPIPEDPEADLGVPGFDYLIEVYHAIEVLETWSKWRNGRVPNASEAIEAVWYFQENDDFLPTPDMESEPPER